ncbi:hypothetical protein T439DRAFT_242823 [Meredithblackwellia eburnea MCA 4105]
MESTNGTQLANSSRSTLLDDPFCVRCQHPLSSHVQHHCLVQHKSAKDRKQEVRPCPTRPDVCPLCGKSFKDHGFRNFKKTDCEKNSGVGYRTCWQTKAQRDRAIQDMRKRAEKNLQEKDEYNETHPWAQLARYNRHMPSLGSSSRHMDRRMERAITSLQLSRPAPRDFFERATEVGVLSDPDSDSFH